MCCDNGGEYSSNDFKLFCKTKGIQIQQTIPYTPQLNGTAERLNRTLLEKARAMLMDSKLKKDMWGEAILCATYLLNRSPTTCLKPTATPAQMFYQRKPNLKNLKVFGCLAYCHIPKNKIFGKFEPKGESCIMIGYTHNGYRLWNPEKRNVFEARDVIFCEDKTIADFRNTVDDKVLTIVNEYGTENQNANEENITQDTIEDTSKVENEKENEDRQPTRTNKPEREHRLPARYADFEMNIDDDETQHFALCVDTFIENVPNTYTEAVNEGSDWQEAIEKELKAHETLGTWESAELPEGKKAIDTKWVFKIKTDGTKKARLVAKGFQQNTIENVYAPVARLPTVRLLLSKSIQENLPLKHLDIPIAFLNGELETEIYIKIPEGLQQKKGKVLKLRKALYGLKGAPRCWYGRLHEFIVNNGFKQSKHDFCLYTNEDTSLLIFVDDILVLGNDENIINKFKTEFNAKNLGKINMFLGMEIKETEKGIEIRQTQMINKVLRKFQMANCNGARTPMETNLHVNIGEEEINVPYRELVGSLMYLAIVSRPDITFAICLLSRYLDKPTAQLWTAAKRVLRYLKQTADKGLIYTQSTKEELNAYSDADWAGDRTDRKSVSGAAIFYRGNLIQWLSRKQSTVALSTAEAEYVASALTATELIYIKGLLHDLNKVATVKCQLFVDNQSTIKLIENYENSKRAKHIDIKVHFIKDALRKRLLFFVIYTN